MTVGRRLQRHLVDVVVDDHRPLPDRDPLGVEAAEKGAAHDVLLEIAADHLHLAGAERQLYRHSMQPLRLLPIDLYRQHLLIENDARLERARNDVRALTFAAGLERERNSSLRLRRLLYHQCRQNR